MSVAEDNGPDRSDDDMLAAEYVAGVLPADERQMASRRIDTEPAFARLVDQWEVRLAPLGNAYQPVEPPASVKAAIDRRLFTGAERRRPVDQPCILARACGCRARRSRGRYCCSLRQSARRNSLPLRLVASLAAEGSDVRYLAVYDAARCEVSLSHVSGERASGRDFELWMIEGSNPPVSMGVIPVGATTHIVITPEIRDRLASGAVLAISLEPAGGSPTGQPTGPVVATGDLKNI